MTMACLGVPAHQRPWRVTSASRLHCSSAEPLQAVRSVQPRACRSRRSSGAEQACLLRTYRRGARTPPRALTRPRRAAQIELAVGEPPCAPMPLHSLALKKVQCAAPVLTVAAGGRDFSEARAPRW